MECNYKVDQTDRKLSNFSKISTIILVISPILQTYGWGKYDFAFISTSVLAVYYVFFKKVRNRIPQLLVFYLLYCVVSTFLSATSVSSLFQLSILRVFLTYLLFFDVVPKDYLIKVYRFVGFVCLSFFFIQEIFALTGFRISGIAKFLPLALSVDNVADYYSSVLEWNRSASFFSEPAYYAQMMLPLLCVELFYDKHKYHYFYALGIVLSLLLSKSGNALFGLAVVGISFFVYLLNSRPTGKNLLLIISFVIFSVFGSIMFLKSSAGDEVLGRQDQLSQDATSGQSGFIRIFRGYYVYEELSFFQKTTGVYNAEVIQDKINKCRVAYTFKKGDMSFNLVQNVLIRTGLIGTIIFLFFWIGMLMSSNACGKSIMLVFFLLSFIEALYFKDLMTLYLVLAYKLKT